MNIHAYARVKDEAAREAFCKAVDAAVPNNSATFRFDVLAGKKGLTSTLAAAARSENVIVVFAYVSDAGRDLRECVFNLSELMLTPGVKEIRILNDNIKLTCAEYGEAWKLIHALAGAHGHYGRLNRRLGVRHAWALGVHKGRPPTVRFEDYVDRLSDIYVGCGDKFPSVRKTAKLLKCSNSTAFRLMLQFEQHADTQRQRLT
jgi:hypothetical protein